MLILTHVFAKITYGVLFALCQKVGVGVKIFILVMNIARLYFMIISFSSLFLCEGNQFGISLSFYNIIIHFDIKWITITTSFS